MESYQALTACIGRESEAVAKAMGKGVDLVRKWKEDPIDGSGVRNPLDALLTIVETSLRVGRPVQDVSAVVRCIQERIDPHLSHPSVNDAHADLTTEVSHLFLEHAAAVRDGRISPEERRRLHRESQHIRTALDEYDLALDCEQVS